MPCREQVVVPLDILVSVRLGDDFEVAVQKARFPGATGSGPERNYPARNRTVRD